MNGSQSDFALQNRISTALRRAGGREGGTATVTWT